MTYPYHSKPSPAVQPAPPVSFDGRYAALRDALKQISPENREAQYAAVPVISRRISRTANGRHADGASSGRRDPFGSWAN
jgi:hypothetical protein